MTRAMTVTRDTLLRERLILCVRLGENAPVLEACRAALRGGLRVLEITLTTPGALEIIATLASEPEVCVGAGTVLTPADAAAVAAAGGRFAVSPVCDRELAAAARDLELLWIPGAATPTEALAAWRAGAPLVKIFPAGALGGPAFLRALRGPLPQIPLVPTSGPSAENLAEYLDAGAVALGVGAEVFPPGFTLTGVEGAARKLCRRLARLRIEG
jgi:2-dehydro-3-deoxyphosphogluconate aldolase/(4S)-4-hydroxy-2-oxoglutarate aldolase